MAASYLRGEGADVEQAGPSRLIAARPSRSPELVGLELSYAVCDEGVKNAKPGLPVRTLLQLYGQATSRDSQNVFEFDGLVGERVHRDT